MYSTCPRLRSVRRKRHPECTGKRVIKTLKLGPDVPLKWVQRILNECWKAYAKPTPKRRRVGPRFYHFWR